MAVFTKSNLEDKFIKDLVDDASKIKEIRTWLLDHKIHFQAIVRMWFKELVKTSTDKKLAYMYLAYDVIRHSIKDRPQFVTEFGIYMEKVFKHLVTVDFDTKGMDIIGELIKIWRKRLIFNEDIQTKVEKIWEKEPEDEVSMVCKAHPRYSTNTSLIEADDEVVVVKEMKRAKERLTKKKELKECGVTTDLKIKKNYFEDNSSTKIEYIEDYLKREDRKRLSVSMCAETVAKLNLRNTKLNTEASESEVDLARTKKQQRSRILFLRFQNIQFNRFDELHQHLNRFTSEVKTIRVPVRHKNSSFNFCFLEFDSEQECTRAKKELDELQFKGEEVETDFVDEKSMAKLSSEIFIVKEGSSGIGDSKLPPHLACSVCVGLLKEPVQLPCCKTALCKPCAFAKIEQHNTCWFGFCRKSVVIRKDEVIISAELAIQVDHWKTQNKGRFKEISPVAYLEAKKNAGLKINTSTKIEGIEANFKFDKSSCKWACTDTRAKADALDLKILSSVASENMSKSENDNISNVDESSYMEYFEPQASFNGQMKDKCGLQKKGHSCNNHWLCEKKKNAGDKKEQCTVSAKNSPMRKAMKRRIYCDEEVSEKKSQMCKLDKSDNCEVSGIVRITDASSSKVKTLVNPERREWVKVCGDEIEESINIATEDDGTLLLSSVTAQFPGTIGLKYRNRRTNCVHSVYHHNNFFLAPKEGWTGINFVCIRSRFHLARSDTKNLAVHGLAPNTREEDVKKYFEKFGDVLTVRIVKRVSCLALIRFAEKAVELAVISQTHMINARWCFIAYSNGLEMEMDLHQDDNTHGTAFVGADNVNDNDKNYGEIFVDHVTEALTSDDLRKYFETFGQVLDVHFSEPRKNFAFVQFRDRKIAMSLRNTWHLIQNANVRVGQCVNYGIGAQKAKLHVDTQRAKQGEAARKAKKK